MAIPQKSRSRLQAKAVINEHKRLSKCPVVPTVHVEVSSPKKVIEDCAFSDGTPLKCGSRHVQAGITKNTNVN